MIRKDDRNDLIHNRKKHSKRRRKWKVNKKGGSKRSVFE